MKYAFFMCDTNRITPHILKFIREVLYQSSRGVHCASVQGANAATNSFVCRNLCQQQSSQQEDGEGTGRIFSAVA